MARNSSVIARWKTRGNRSTANDDSRENTRRIIWVTRTGTHNTQARGRQNLYIGAGLEKSPHTHTHTGYSRNEKKTIQVWTMTVFWVGREKSVLIARKGGWRDVKESVSASRISFGWFFFYPRQDKWQMDFLCSNSTVGKIWSRENANEVENDTKKEKNQA